MKQQMIRSDFADEIISEHTADDAYSHEEHSGTHVRVSHVRIHRADNVLGKEPGDYISVEFDSLHEQEAREEVIDMLCTTLASLIGALAQRILVIGLGNRFITSDALGPQVARNVLVTSHLYAQGHAEQLAGTRNVAVLAPGVMGQTGLESGRIIQSVSTVYHPDVIIAVDALATRTIRRINRVIQINNTGIQPGSGIGNHRLAISEQTLHVPVIAMGVATVTSIGAILNEALEDHAQREEILAGIAAENRLDLVVTPKSMDDELTQLAHVLARALNLALHPGYPGF